MTSKYQSQALLKAALATSKLFKQRLPVPSPLQGLPNGSAHNAA